MRTPFALLLLAQVDAHGWSNSPQSRNGADPGFYNIGCQAGCDECSNNNGNSYRSPANYFCTVGGVPVAQGMGVSLPGANTLPQAFRTWNLGNVSAQKDWGKFMPWRAPGRAPVTSPCGIQSGYGPGQGLFPCALYKTKAACKTTPSSGGTGGEPDCAWNATTSKCGQPEGAPPFRPFCEDYPSHCAKKPQGTPGTALPPTVPTAWKAGGVVNVTWQLQVNHGGGFQYRLCAKGAKGGLTEQCFQRTPLAFATDTTVVRWKNGTEIRIAARDVDVGTVPSGSAWRRNPIPACSCDSGVRCNFLNATVPVNTTWDAMYGDAVDPTAPPSSDPTRHGWGCPTGLQFPAPAPGLYGYYAPNSNISNFEMVDEVLVPAVPAGEYAMSWRWDCEQTPQIWASCSDLVITA